MRTAILRAAEELFAERGYNATSVREVVEAAGCQKPTLYYYFKNKEHLYLELLGAVSDEFEQMVHASMSEQAPVRRKLERTLVAYINHLQENPARLRLLLSAERHPEKGQPSFDFAAQRTRLLGMLRTALESGVAAGEIRPNLELDEVLLGLFGMVDHRITLMLHGCALPERYPQIVMDLFFSGVGL